VFRAVSVPPGLLVLSLQYIYHSVLHNIDHHKKIKSDNLNLLRQRVSRSVCHCPQSVCTGLTRQNLSTHFYNIRLRWAQNKIFKIISVLVIFCYFHWSVEHHGLDIGTFGRHSSVITVTPILRRHFNTS
jgi:hypothetical protein